MIRARDLRRALLRALVLVLPLVVLQQVLDGGFEPAIVAMGVMAGVLLLPPWLVEMRAAVRHELGEPNAPFLVWLLVTGGVVLWVIQGAYVWAAIDRGSLDQGVVEAWAALRRLARAPFANFVVLLLVTCPFALAAHVRLRGFEPRSTVFLAAFLLLLPAGCMSLGVAVPIAGAAVWLLVRCYAVADWVDERLFSGPGRAEREAYEAETAALPWGRLWLLAYLDHPPARYALGHRAPEAPRELEAFVLGLEPAGREAAVRAAAVAAGLAAPFLGHHDPTPRAVLEGLDAWSAEPTPERRDAARALLEGWTPTDEVAGRAVREAVGALDGEPPWATRAAIRAAARAADAAARLMDDAAAAREGLRAGLLAWALQPARPRGGEGDVGA